MGQLSGVYGALDSTDIPIMASAVIASSGVKANAAAVVTITPPGSATAYVTGFQVSASGATAASNVVLTLSGVVNGPIAYSFTFPAGAGVPAQPFVVSFYPAIPASGPGVAIALTLPAGGAGNASASVALQGFSL